MWTFTRLRAEVYLVAFLVMIAGIAALLIHDAGPGGSVTDALTGFDVLVIVIAFVVIYCLGFLLARDRLGGPELPIPALAQVMVFGLALGVQLLIGLGIPAAVRALAGDGSNN